MKRMMARLRTAGAIGLMAGSLAALPAFAEPTTLSFATWQLDEPGNSDWWHAVIAAFEEAHPDITIDAEQIPNKDFATQMTVRFASNRPPDVVQLSATNFPSFAAEGWLEPLDDRIAGTIYETEWSALQEANVWDGHTLAISMSGSTYMLFYNERVLEEAGVPVPTSFDEFVASVPKVTDRDNGVFGLVAVTADYPTISDDFLRFLKWQDQKLVEDGQYNLTSPGVVAALETYRQTVGQNAPLGNVSAIARQLFIDGKAGFLVDGPWVLSWLQKASPEMQPLLHLVAAPFNPPVLPGGLNLQISAGIDDDRKDLAWSFIEFATQPEWQRQFLLMTGQPPAWQGDVLSAEDRAANPVLETILEATKGAVPLHPTEQAIRANSAEFLDIIRNATLRLLTSSDPTAEIMEETQQELERAVPLS